MKSSVSAARVWTIEYQKRGLPHLHLLVFLEDSDHFLEPEVIDEMVCAEADRELTDIVKSAMIHGPCGELNDQAPCMDGEKACTKRYPRAFCEETLVGEDGYPLYRRRDHPHTVQIDNCCNPPGSVACFLFLRPQRPVTGFVDI